jgi:hypothetical protein
MVDGPPDVPETAMFYLNAFSAKVEDARSCTSCPLYISLTYLVKQIHDLLAEIRSVSPLKETTMKLENLMLYAVYTWI